MVNRAKYLAWMKVNVHTYTDTIGDVNMTNLAEGCARNYGVMTYDGNSDDEELIFELATLFFNG